MQSRNNSIDNLRAQEAFDDLKFNELNSHKDRFKN